MKTATKVAIGAAVLFTVSSCSVIGSVIGFNNDCVTQEAGIKAQYEQNQNNYDNYFKKLKEVSQVPEMYADDLKKVYDGAIKGRYGDGGSKAVFQFLKEQNPNFDASMYKQIQQVIESGRNSFAADQKTLLDKKRVYETTVKTFPGVMVAGMLGYPKIDLNAYGIVTSEETQDAFKTKKSAPIQLRGGQS